MAELKIYQKEIGKVELPENHRAFVLNDGRIIASDYKHPDFIKNQKEKHQKKQQKMRDIKLKALERGKKSAKKGTKTLLIEQRARERLMKQEIKLKDQKVKLEKQRAELDKRINKL